MAKASQKTKTKKAPPRRQTNVRAWLILGAIPLVLLGLFWLLRKNVRTCSWVARHVSDPYRAFMGQLTSRVPFSLMETLIAAAILFVIVYIILMIVRIVRRPEKLRTFARRVGALVIVCLWALAWFCWFFGVEYSVPGFAARNGITTGQITPEQLYSVTEYFAENASRLAPQMNRDELGTFVTDEEALFRNSAYIYNDLQRQFPSIAAGWVKPKPMFFSKLFSMMGFTGMYFPFTGECNINMDFPAAGRPFTIAHELAHSRGVISEDEANFVGVAACLSSGDPVYEYSGWLSGYTYLQNALYKTDRELWQQVSGSLSDYVRIDMRDSSAYWNRNQSAVTTAAETVYDSYLKSNGESRGISSYDDCVELLVTYYGDKI